MLVNFTFKNFRSFREGMTLRMESTSAKDLAESAFSISGEELLPVALICGPNSSGKSNALKALKLKRDIVLNSVRLNPHNKLQRDTFCLDTHSYKEPTSFEIQFIIKDSKFR